MLQSEPVVQLDTPLTAQLAVGKGQFQVLQGTLSWQGKAIHKALVTQPADRNCLVELFPETEGHIKFFMRIPWREEDIGKHATLSLQVYAGQQSATIDLGMTELISQPEENTSHAYTLGDDPLIAICMAMYQPDLERFARQLESIVCQSYENWLLIISDDASSDINRSELEALCNIDPRRIRLYQHDTNVGFYHNFERALKYIPDNTAYIAFADQDDIWYPDKLHKLVSCFRDEQIKLVYSDMRLLDDSGNTIAESYWQGRKNEYKDFDTVFLANTVTGAASLFRRELLEVALPFPARIGNAFHDHWLACVALCSGKIAYVDEALYDYVQYDDSVIGHCDFEKGALRKRLFRISNGSDNQRINLYRKEYLRLQTMAETLKVRLPVQAANPTLKLTDGSWLSPVRLFKTYLKMLTTKRTSNQAELSLLLGFVLRKWQQFKS